MGGVPTSSSEGEELIATLLSHEMLLGAAIFLETAMLMIVLSRLLNQGTNCWVNIILGLLHTAAVIVSVFVGSLTIYYTFFVVIEVTTSLFTVWYAWTWHKPKIEIVCS